MVGIIDSMHWDWKNCQFALQVHVGEYTIILNVVASQDLILHSFFGMEDFHNDIDVLQCSLVFSRLQKANI
jgi:hypothetical protein